MATKDSTPGEKPTPGIPKIAQQGGDNRKGGLGRGLAALIPAGPGEGASASPRPRLGDGASDVVIGGSKGSRARSSVRGAPTFGRPTETPATMRKVVQQQENEAAAEFGATYQEIPIGLIAPNYKNPRTVFDEEELNELVHSIREFGLLQPIVVRPDGPNFELIMGERRWRAATKAGLRKIPAIVRDTSDEDMLRDALLENIHRVQLNPLEEAAAYQQLLEEFDVTQAELADRLGRSRPVITNMIRLLQLPVGVQRRVAAGVLSAGHARAILGLKAGEAAQTALADRVVAESLSVRATEEAVTLANRDGVLPEKKVREPVEQPAYLTTAAESLADEWDTKVSITRGKRKGKIVVEFGDREDFDRIMALIKGAEGAPGAEDH